MGTEFVAKGMATTRYYWKNLMYFSLGVLAVYIAMYVVGLPIAVAALVVVYGKFVGQVRWRARRISGVVVFVFLAYFSYVLVVFWPDSLIIKWVHLPRLLGGIK